MMKRTFIFPAFILTFSLSACSGVSDKEIQQLLEKTKQNLVFVEGGSFMMGDGGATYTDQNGNTRTVKQWTGYTDNKPAHKVTLDSYYIQKYEVTWAEFDLFSKATAKPLHLKDFRKEMRLPIVPAGVGSWQNAKDYCQWLARESGLPYDLPTEAQWEYAARSRGLKKVLYATDNGLLERRRNYGKGYETLPLGVPKPVGLHPPNPLGIYDMMGNVEEYVDDWYSPNYYAKSPEHNPSGPTETGFKLTRGGSVAGSQEYNTVYSRSSRNYDFDRRIYAGVRCVVKIEKLN